jgi:hypothetical protein
VAAGELILRADIEDARRSATQAVEQFIARYRLEFVARPEITRHHARDLGAVALADAAEGAEQPNHRILAGQPIIDPLAIASAFDERGAAKQLQMARAIGHGEADPAGQVFDAALALPEMFQVFDRA